MSVVEWVAGDLKALADSVHTSTNWSPFDFFAGLRGDPNATRLAMRAALGDFDMTPLTEASALGSALAPSIESRRGGGTETVGLQRVRARSNSVPSSAPQITGDMAMTREYTNTNTSIVGVARRKPVTVADIEGIAAEAEAGYDVSTLRWRGGRPPMGSGPAEVVQVRLDQELHVV